MFSRLLLREKGLTEAAREFKTGKVEEIIPIWGGKGFVKNPDSDEGEARWGPTVLKDQGM